MRWHFRQRARQFDDQGALVSRPEKRFEEPETPLGPLRKEGLPCWTFILVVTAPNPRLRVAAKLEEQRPHLTQHLPLHLHQQRQFRIAADRVTL